VAFPALFPLILNSFDLIGWMTESTYSIQGPSKILDALRVCLRLDEFEVKITQVATDHEKPGFFPGFSGKVAT
jgi:hypothetical protein